jgi:hypothetical protein
MAALLGDTETETGMPEGIVPDGQRLFQAGHRRQYITPVKLPLPLIEFSLSNYTCLRIHLNLL